MTLSKLTPEDSETKSANLFDENLAQLKELFPEVVTESSEGPLVNVDVLKGLLGDRTVTDTEEKYGLNWFGKRLARQIALTPSTGTLRPCLEDSVDWDTTQNLMIEGDNLEVLKLLQKSYSGKVKFIYIDPPYNTGNDFVYRDNFKDSINNYLELTGNIDGGLKVSSNSETSGRYHTDWLNMIYPRIKLARNLLREDGTILISIDDGEVDNLKKVCTEIFGEENFVTSIIWQKKYSPSNDAKWLSDNHDFLLLFAKNKEKWRPNLLPRTEEANARYANPDNDPRGDWKPSGLDVKTYSVECDYEIITPSGRKVRPPAGACWRFSKTKFAEMVADNRIWFGKEGNNVPSIKRFLTEVKQGITPLTIWTYDEVGHNQEATQELRALGVIGFDSPKPVRLLARGIQMCSSGDDIVMDFFAGSGTFGQATWVQNLKDEGKRRFILVQLPEPLDPSISEQKNAAEFCDKINKPRSIVELTKHRLRQAAKKIIGENPGLHNDLGFRVLKLAESNFKTWDSKPENLEEDLLSGINHIRSNRTESDILHELILKLGIDLCIPINSISLCEKPVYFLGNGIITVCLAEKITSSDIEGLALEIVKTLKTLKPIGDPEVFFLDSAFYDDISKTNMAAIFTQYGIKNIHSL